MTTLLDRILATRALAVERLALAEAATPGPWFVEHGRIWSANPAFVTFVMELASMSGTRGWMPDAAYIAANDPTTMAQEQWRVIRDCDADLAVLARLRELCADETLSDEDAVQAMVETLTSGFDARYPEKEDQE